MGFFVVDCVAHRCSTTEPEDVVLLCVEAMAWDQTGMKICYWEKNTGVGFETPDKKAQTMGHQVSNDTVADAKVLNRIVRHTHCGSEGEASKCHTEIIFQQVRPNSSRGLSCLGLDEQERAREEPDALTVRLVKAHRSIVANFDYLFQGRPEIVSVVKAGCRSMASPTMGSWGRLHLIGQYLRGRVLIVDLCVADRRCHPR